jgi:hypothetical protein
MDIPSKTAGRQGLIVVRPHRHVGRVYDKPPSGRSDAYLNQTIVLLPPFKPSIVRSAKALFQISEKNTIGHETGRFNPNRREATSTRPLDGGVDGPDVLGSVAHHTGRLGSR